MKIVFLTRLYLPHVGGVEKHVREVSLKLKKKGNIVKIITEKYDDSLKDFEIIDGLEVYRIKALNKWQTWLEIWKLKTLFQRSDVVHIHDVFYWYFPLLWLNKKTFITFHGYEGSNIPNWKQVFWHRLAAKLTKGNICIGDFHKKWYGVNPDFISYGAA